MTYNVFGGTLNLAESNLTVGFGMERSRYSCLACLLSRIATMVNIT